MTGWGRLPFESRFEPATPISESILFTVPPRHSCILTLAGTGGGDIGDRWGPGWRSGVTLTFILPLVTYLSSFFRMPALFVPRF